MKSFKFNGFRLFGLLGCVVVVIGLILYSHFVVLAGCCLTITFMWYLMCKVYQDRLIGCKAYVFALISEICLYVFLFVLAKCLIN
jgi:hypothetical protein